MRYVKPERLRLARYEEREPYVKSAWNAHSALRCPEPSGQSIH